MRPISSNNEPDDDFKVEITPLDPPETPERISDTLLQGSRLAPRVRTWLTVLSGMGSLLLIVIVLSTVLPSLWPKAKSTPPLFHAPVQVQDVIIQGNAAYIASSDGVGRMLRMTDGALLWQRPLPDVTPVFVQNILYIYYYDQRFYTVQALRVSDGKPLWTFKTPSSTLVPLIINNGITTILPYSPQRSYSNGQSQSPLFVALDGNTGAELWQQSIHISSPMNINVQQMSDKIYVSMWSDSQAHHIILWVLKNTDGTLLWHYVNPDLGLTTPETAFPPNLILPLTLNGPVYLERDDGSVRAMDANNGYEVWQYKPANRNDMTSMTGTSHFYIQTVKGAVKALRPDNGAVDWSYNDPAGIITLFSETNSVLYARTSDGFVVALRANDGKKLWRVQPVASPYSTDALYIEGNTGYTFTQIGNATDAIVAAVRVSDGITIWQRKVSISGNLLFPEIDQDQIFIHAGTTITALRTLDGNTLWQAQHVQSTFQYGPPLAIVGAVVLLRSSSGALEVHQAQTGAVLWRYPRA